MMNEVCSPRVSVVIPAYNAERTIGDAIRSVLEGTFDDFELVICEDASTDRTLKVIEQFSDARIRVLRNDSNSGEGVTRDRAIAAARGRWIAPLDADDAFAPGRLATLVRVAEAHPGAVVFDEVMLCHDTRSGMLPWRPSRVADAYPGAQNEIREIAFADWIRHRHLVMQPLIPTCLITQAQLRHSRSLVGADIGFRCRLLGLSGAPLWYVPQAMYLYRISPTGMSGTTGGSDMLAAELEASVPAFGNDTKAVAALLWRAGQSRRTSQCREFYTCLRQLHLFAAARKAAANPWLISEFVRRFADRVPYHLSRMRHRGARR
jgi:succinoglycan biosynthesis protein ExoO